MLYRRQHETSKGENHLVLIVAARRGLRSQPLHEIEDSKEHDEMLVKVRRLDSGLSLFFLHEKFHTFHTFHADGLVSASCFFSRFITSLR